MRNIKTVSLLLVLILILGLGFRFGSLVKRSMLLNHDWLLDRYLGVQFFFFFFQYVFLIDRSYEDDPSHALLLVDNCILLSLSSCLVKCCCLYHIYLLAMSFFPLVTFVRFIKLSRIHRAS